MSNAWSATTRFRRAFSFSRALQLLGHLRGHPAVLLPPPVVGLLADAQLPANLRHLQPFAQRHVRLTQLPHDLLRTASLLHQEPFPATWPTGFSHKTWIKSRGGGHLPRDMVGGTSLSRERCFDGLREEATARERPTTSPRRRHRAEPPGGGPDLRSELRNGPPPELWPTDPPILPIVREEAQVLSPSPIAPKPTGVSPLYSSGKH